MPYDVEMPRYAGPNTMTVQNRLPVSQAGDVGSERYGLVLMFFGAIQFGAGLALFTTGARLVPAANVALLSVLEPILGAFWV